MSRQYSLRKFLREAPKKLLRQYLSRKGAGADLPWASLRETAAGADPIFRAIESADQTTRDEIDRDFQDIYDMADEGGLQVLIEEARNPHHRPDLAEAVGKMSGPLETAFWVLLNDPRAFDIASHFDRADSVPDQRWLKRIDLPPATPLLGDEAKSRLENALSEYYRFNEGRGHNCHVDQWARGNRLYWFAYLDDYAEARMVYEKGEMRRAVQRPVFEVIFTYCDEERSLDVFARGGAEKIAHLQRLFGQAILGVELDEQSGRRVTYELGKLLNRDCPLPFSAADGIEAVRVRRLRLKVIGSGNRRITVEANARHDPRAVYDLIDDVLAGERIPRDLLVVQQAGLQLVFRRDSGRRRSTLSFDVSHPSSCSLKHEAKHEAARELLKRWGIDVSGRAQDNPVKRGRAVQTRIRG